MRALVLSMAFFSMMKICGTGAESTPSVASTATGAIAVTAQHGGVMVAADDGAWIELVTKQNGEVEAYVVDAQGQPVPQERAAVSAVQVQGRDGRSHEVQLRWDPDARRYAGRIEVAPAAEAPAEVQLVVRGQPRRARAPRLIVVPVTPAPPAVLVQPGAPPPAVVVQPGAPTPPRGRVVAAPPSASATVVVQAPQPPQPTVVVQAPQPPQPTVVVQAPQPPAPAVVVQSGRRSGVTVVAPTPPAPVVVAPAPPRPGVVVVDPTPRPGVVVVDAHPGRGHGHRRHGHDDDRGAAVVVTPPHPGAVVVTPPHPGAVVVTPPHPGAVVVTGGRGRGRGRGH